MNGRLIITADDYGMCETVNQAIEECLAAGSVRATCVMTNMPKYDEAGNLRNRFLQSSLGIHWTLTEGCPVLPPSQVSSLVRKDGSFHSVLELRGQWLRRRVEVTELKAELRAQFQRFREVAGEPDFWNTHENFHVLPVLFDICVSMGRELRIPAMRCHRRFTVPRNRTPTYYNLRHPLYWLKGLGISRWSKRVEGEGVLMPDGRVYMPGYTSDEDSIEEVVSRLPWASIKKAVELVIHPATTNRDAMFRVHAERRVLEYQVFRDAELRKRLRSNGVETVGFEVLHR